MASLAWIVGHGGVAALYYASRLWQFPLGLFGVSIVTFALSTLARHGPDTAGEAFRAPVLLGIRSVAV